MGDQKLRQRAAAGAIAVIALVPLLAAIVRADGYHANEVDLNDAGVWVTNELRGSVGRINTQIKSIEVRFKPPAPKADVVQSNDAVILVDTNPKASRMFKVNVATLTPSSARKIPAGSKVDLNGGTGMLLDTKRGGLWLDEATRLGGIDYKSAPRKSVGPNAVGVVGVDGVVRTYAKGAAATQSFDLAGRQVSDDVSLRATKPQITAVGATAVLLDGETSKLEVVGGPTVDLTRVGRHPVLQQPSTLTSDVVVASDAGLYRVRLSDGLVTKIYEVGAASQAAPTTVRPSAPVVLAGCAYGAWLAQATAVQACDGKDVQATKLKGLEPRVKVSTPSAAETPAEEQSLRFRVNRGRVVLNDRPGNVSWLFTEDKPEPIDDWDQAESDDKPNEEAPPSADLQIKKERCTAKPPRPTVKPMTIGTRPGRPVIVNVLDNVQGDPCDVMTVRAPVQPQGARVDVISDGRALQVTPVEGQQSTITVGYEVTGRTGLTGSTTLTIPIVPLSKNTKPTVPKEQTTVVEAGRTVRHDVLQTVTDPDGDSVALTDAVLPDGEGEVRFQSDGAIYFTAGSTTPPGQMRVEYTVQDEHDGTNKGILNVSVTGAGGNLAPTARNDHVVGAVGQEISINLLANDTDPNGDQMTVVPSNDMQTSIAPKIDVQSGRLTVTPIAGTTYFTYSVVDGEGGTGNAAVRVDGTDPDKDAPPIAVRDDLVARPDAPAMVDLLDNDISPSGKILAVTEVTQPTDSRLVVELLEMRVARITASADFRVAEVLHYTIFDGSKTSDGVLVVRPNREPGTPQPVHTERDRATVKAGNLVSIPVLANDSDPLGEPLKLTSVHLADEKAGDLFMAGESVRFLAAPSATPGTYQATYAVRSRSGVDASAELSIQILPADARNRPPGPIDDIQVRVFSGGLAPVRVPLVGLDPDGDPVGIVARSDSPAHGQVQEVAEGYVYTPDSGFTGTDQFSYLVQDPAGLEARGDVLIVVAPRPAVNRPPVAVPDKVIVQVNSPRPILVMANDSDPDDDTISLVKEAIGKPRLGSVSIADDGSTLMYQAPRTISDDTAGDAFTYEVSDGKGDTGRATVSVILTKEPPPPEPPVARDDFVRPQDAGATVKVPVLANDVDPDGLTSALKVDVRHAPSEADVEVQRDGTIEVRVRSTSVAFAYRVTDPDGASGWAVVQIPVRPEVEIQAPDFEGPTIDAGKFADIDVLAQVPAVNGRKPQLTQVLNASQGTVQIIDPTTRPRVRFTALPDATGNGRFDYQVRLGTKTRTGTVRIPINGKKLVAPRLVGTSMSLRAGESRSLDVRSLSVEPAAGPLTFDQSVTGANEFVKAKMSGSVLTVEAPDLDELVEQNANLTVTARNADGLSAEALVTVRVDPDPSEPPTAAPDDESTFEDEAVVVNVLENDTFEDPNTRPAITSQFGGTATVLSDGKVKFQPTKTGTVGFSYQITDAKGRRPAEANVTITVLARPGKPLPPIATATSHAVSLTWSPPVEGASTVTGYVVQSDDGRSKTLTETAWTFTDLPNGKEYRFRVAATNPATDRTDNSKLNFSDYSIPVKPNQVPDVPAAPTVVAGDQEVTITWVAPPSDGTAITDYELQNLSGEVQPLPASSSSYTWGGLVNGSSNAFKVRALNEAGEGGWSEFSDPSTGVPAGKPFPPGSVSAVREDSNRTVGGAARVSWTAANDNGATIESYDVIAMDGTSAQGTIQASGSETSKVVTGLTNGRAYTFRVIARNRVGASDPGESGSVTPLALPAKPAAPTATPGDQAATLTFPALTGAETGGSPVTYAVVSGGSGSGSCSPGGSTVTCTVTGLTNASSYTFTVQASNELGTGPTSNPSDPVVPFGDPAAPVFGASSRSTGKLTWTWSVPDGNGRPIIGYDVELDGEPKGRMTETTYTAQGLGSGETHRLNIRAVNEGNKVSEWVSQQATTPSPPTIGAIQDDFIGCHTPAEPLEGADVRYSAYIQLNGHSFSDLSNETGEAWWTGGTGNASYGPESVQLDPVDANTARISVVFFHANLRTVTQFRLSVVVAGAPGRIDRVDGRNDGDYIGTCPQDFTD